MLTICIACCVSLKNTNNKNKISTLSCSYMIGYSFHRTEHAGSHLHERSTRVHIWNLPQIPPRLWRFTRVNARTSQSVQLLNGIATCFVNCFNLFDIAYALNAIAAAQYISTATLHHILSIKFHFLHSYRVQKRYRLGQDAKKGVAPNFPMLQIITFVIQFKLQSISTLSAMLTVIYLLRLKYCNSWKSWNQNELPHWKPLELHIVIRTMSCMELKGNKVADEWRSDYFVDFLTASSPWICIQKQFIY